MALNFFRASLFFFLFTASPACHAHSSVVRPSAVHRPRRLDSVTKLTATPSVLHGQWGDVNVSWSGVSFGSSRDYVGVFEATANLSSFTAPIEFKYAAMDHEKTPPPDGSVTFTLLDRRVDYQFVYISGDSEYPEIKAQSNAVQFDSDVRRPHGGHLALGADSATMEIYWTQQVAVAPKVLWTTESGRYDGCGSSESRRHASYVPASPCGIVCSADADCPTAVGSYCMNDDTKVAPFFCHHVGKPCTCGMQTAASPAITWTREYMCDRLTSPAARDGFLDAGVKLMGAMTDLVVGQTYFYKFGDDGQAPGTGDEGDDEGAAWSVEGNFTVGPQRGNQRVVFAAFGDMGNAPVDDAWQHSWDFEDKGEVPAPSTQKSIERDLSTGAASGDEGAVAPDLVLHIGDISYAVGYEGEWDQFLAQMETVARQVPWMTGIGNHEQGWSESLYGGSDSGGECGVPYNGNFPFASHRRGDPLQSRADFQAWEPWYSFDYGPVHTVVMSTEHNFVAGSPQQTWIAADLASVNRTATPFVLFSGHRPMYVSSGWAGDQSVADTVRDHIEPLLVQHDVTLAIWGHHHSYQRTCAVANKTCDEKGGVPHVVMGTAGYELAPEIPTGADIPAYIAYANNTQYGFCRLDFRDGDNAEGSSGGGPAPTLHLSWVTNVDGKQGVVLDSAVYPASRRGA